MRAHRYKKELPMNVSDARTSWDVRALHYLFFTSEIIELGDEKSGIHVLTGHFQSCQQMAALKLIS